MNKRSYGASLVVSFLATLAAVGCGSEPNVSFDGNNMRPQKPKQSSANNERKEGLSNQHAPVESAESLSLADAKTAWCPQGAILDTTHWLCIQGDHALGPFPKAMVDSCTAAGGGTKACSGARWNAALARKIRGSTACPPGTNLDNTIEECRSGEDIFGPFSKALVEHCLASTNGSEVCRTQRIHHSYARQLIARERPPVATPPLASNNPLPVPYFYQYSNTLEPARTCNITSVAMVAKYLGLNVTPDQVYRKVGGPVFTGPDMVWVAERLGLKGTHSQTANIERIKSQIDAGRPVIVQGWFTESGHILVITGYDSKGWIVNDPAGLWSSCFKCGYALRNASNGHSARYSYAAMARAATDPGNPNSYWITVLNR
jgi:uncharacterized protein YvpB